MSLRRCAAIFSMIASAASLSGTRCACAAFILSGSGGPPAARVLGMEGREAGTVKVERISERRFRAAVSGLDPGGAVSALCELELLGLATQVPGRRYQRV